MVQFLPRDDKGRIHIGIVAVLVWLIGVVLIAATVFILIAVGIGEPFGSGDDLRRGEQLGKGAALMSAWIAGIAAVIVWFVRKRRDNLRR